ncbi:hypothetical protein ACVI1J_000343 [Bradyrhizobium diazoefficiens]
MAISLKGSVKKKSAAEDQPIITIYGVPKIGKSSLASEFPRPVFIQTAAGESVPAGIVADTIEVRNYNDLCEAIGALVNEEHNRAGPGCLDSAPLDLSGFLPGYAERGALRFCRCVGRA